MGMRILVMVIQSIMNSFDIFGVVSDTDKGNVPPSWMMFLGGEFTFACLFQIGYHYNLEIHQRIHIGTYF